MIGRHAFDVAAIVVCVILDFVAERAVTSGKLGSGGHFMLRYGRGPLHGRRLGRYKVVVCAGRLDGSWNVGLPWDH
jgi:hypothetical protein